MEDLARRLARGEPAAFAELYDCCGDKLHHFLVVRLGSRDAAGDVMQETFVRLARAHKRFAAVADPIAYTFAAARNEADRALRARGHERLVAADLFVAGPPGDVRATEAAESVAAALARLGPQLSEVVELKHYAELSLREIAALTGVPPGTAATRYRTAMQRLREYLAKEWT